MRFNPTVALAAVAVLAALALVRPTAAADNHIVTDGYTATAPHSPWKRVKAFDESGHVMYSVPPKTAGATTQLTLNIHAVAEDTPRAAMAAQIERERATVRSETEDREGIERSSFRADSMSVGGLKWKGFRVDVKTKSQRGSTWRWVALHPDFPNRRRVFVMSFDEYASLKTGPVATRLADARAVAASVKPHGPGWRGPLREGFGDARIVTFAARIDSTMRLCWSEDPDVIPPMRALGYGPGIAIEGDFFEVTTQATRDSLVDAAPTEYGIAFDRNRDGRCDLIVINRGVQNFEGERLLPIVAALGDDDFDGKLDCAVFENADLNADGKADHRTFVQDTDGDGSADIAIAFRDAVDEPGAKKLEVKDGIVTVRLAGQVAPALTFDDVLGPESAHLVRLDAARASCKLAPQAALPRTP